MIPKEFWERFKNEKIAVNCQTEDEAKDFVKQCYENNIEWSKYSNNSNIKYGSKFTNYTKYENGIYYRIFRDFRLVNNEAGLIDENINYYRNNNYKIIPYSEVNKSIKEENKMQFSPNGYSYRGQVFRDIEDYAKYILKCAEDDKAKAEKEKQNKLKAEKARRTEELDKAYAEYFETCTEAKEKYLKIKEQYCKDYNIIIQNTNSKTYSPCKIYDIIDEIVFGK